MASGTLDRGRNKAEASSRVLSAQVHFSCDPRAKTGELGTFRDYATGERPLTYICSRCAEASAVQAAKKQKTSS